MGKALSGTNEVSVVANPSLSAGFERTDDFRVICLFFVQPSPLRMRGLLRSKLERLLKQRGTRGLRGQRGISGDRVRLLTSRWVRPSKLLLTLPLLLTP